MSFDINSVYSHVGENPIFLLALTGASANFRKGGNARQRITLRKEIELFIVELPHAPIALSTGLWEVTHETLFNNNWQRGIGRNNGAYIAEFDDHPTGGGDNDFNDAVVEFRV